MQKKPNAVYAPGELSRVRDKLGVKDEAEAKRMAQLLGGEVGTEREPEPDPRTKRTRRETVEVVVGGRRSRRIDVASLDDEETNGKKNKSNEPYPGDDPNVSAKLGYRERVKIDQYAGQVVFEIKTSFQILSSVFSFFKEPVDYVNPRFVTKRLNEYYQKLEKLVTASRNLFPKSNSKRNGQLKRTSPIIFKVIDTLRSWDIEQISVYISELQSHPREVVVSDFVELLREIYKPLFVLSDFNLENMKAAFKFIYKILYIESPMEAKDKYQDVIRNIIASILEIRRDVQFGMYPLLMKLISDKFIPYERFFIERRRRYMAFLKVTEADLLNSAELVTQQVENIDVETLQQNISEETSEESDGVREGSPEEDPNDPKVIARKEREEAERAEQRVLDNGKVALEAIFPKAGWDKLEEFPDLYPYFARVYSLRGGYELIAPTDPLQQVSVLMYILDDLFIGLRYVSFGVVIGPDGKQVKISDELGDIINNWRDVIEASFNKEYLPRLSEYCRMLENSGDARLSIYARKTLNELYWLKRLYFLPYYKFDSLGPPPFQKQDITPIYTQIRKLRKYLTTVAMGIEHGLRAGGAAALAPCEGINNPWEPYNFQVPNPTSKRLEMLLPAERRNNATLVFFALSTVAILDYVVNNENSWSYGNRSSPLFRSVKDEGIIPLFGVDKKLDADQIFKDSLKKKG